MRLGLCLAALSARGIDEAAAFASKLGLTAVDLPTDRRLGLVGAEVAAGTRQFDRLAATLSDAGLEVSAVSNSSECRMLLGLMAATAMPGLRARSKRRGRRRCEPPAGPSS